MTDTASSVTHILVVGAGAAAHGFVGCLLRDPGAAVRVTVIGDERHGPYDRSSLARLLGGMDPEALQLDRAVFRDDRVRLIRDDRVLHIDRSRRMVRTRARRSYSYDTLVLATGSHAARIAVEGADLPGCFVFRTIDDVEAVRAFAAGRAREMGRPLRGTVIGGGLQGLQAAIALQAIGIATTVVQYPDRVMPAHLDRAAAEMLRGALQRRGVAVRTRTRTTRLDPDESGAVTALEFQDGTFHRTDIVIFTVGVRPRDELARNAGLDVDARGGVLVDDRCGTSDPHILATGEVARFDDVGASSAAPSPSMEEVAAARVLGGEHRLRGSDASLRMTLGGIDVASFGEPLPRADVVEVVLRNDQASGAYRKVVLTDDARTLVGGVLVGDVRAYDSLRALVGARPGTDASARRLPIEDLRTDADTTCAHIGMSPARLLEELRDTEVTTFSRARTRFGRAGCDTCTLAIARGLTALIQEREGEDGRNHRPARLLPLSRVLPDRTYAVLPRTGEGTSTPAALMALGRIAEEFHLEPRILEGRIELWGARRRQLSAVMDRLSEVGLAPVDHDTDAGAEEAARPRPAHGSRASLPTPSSATAPVSSGWGYRLAGAET